jgi:hypothetical protein
MKTTKECLAAQLQKYSLATPAHIEELERYLLPIYDAMEYYAEHAVNEQREIMAKHLNLRNVPRPKLEEISPI